MAEVHLDEGAVEEMLNTPDGPVGVLLDELSSRAATVARVIAPVMRSRYHSEYYQYGPPGYTKGKIRQHFPAYSNGQLYGGVNAPYGPTLFLERPARQIHTTRYRFMSMALDTVEL